MPAESKSREPSTSPNPFVGFPNPPGPEDVREALGRSAGAWDALRASISEAFGPLEEEWAVPAKKYGWSLRLKKKKRIILHLGPRSNHFTVAVILGEKAVAALRESELGPEVIAMVEDSAKFTEGRVIRFEIRSIPQIDLVLALAKVKLDN